MITIDPGVIRRIADMHAVYRLFDHAGRLLYIGMSGRAGRRFDEHAMKNWWPLVSMITLEWHDTAAAAALAERQAIAAERPRYNVVGTPVARKRAAKVAAGAPREAPEPKAEPPDVRDVLSDVLGIFGDAKGLHWQIVAERLAGQFPARWDGVTRDVISAQCRALGVPGAHVRMGQKVLAGCRRADVERIVTQQVLQAG